MHIILETAGYRTVCHYLWYLEGDPESAYDVLQGKNCAVFDVITETAFVSNHLVKYSTETNAYLRFP